MEHKKIKIAALADIHVGQNSKGSFVDIFSQISNEADVLLLCGDLTTRGLPEEIEILAQDLTACKIPVLAVMGNHDHESGKHEELKQILIRSRVNVLDGTADVINDVGFAGTKGFCGGFDKYMLSSFGEEPIKKFVDSGVQESLKLEKAISSLQNEHKIVLLHYSPILETVKGEPEAIFSFLGSSRLAEPIDRYNVSAVFHGHAHHGSPEGKTIKGIPVYNVAYPLLKKASPKKPYKIIEI